MVRKVLQMMAVLGEDEASHKLTFVYHKCLDLTMEKRRLNTKQTVLGLFCFRLGCMHACMCHKLVDFHSEFNSPVPVIVQATTRTTRWTIKEDILYFILCRWV